MVKSPDEIIERLKAQSLKKLEGKIDYFLVSEYKGEGISFFHQSDLRIVNEEDITALLDKYRKQGWTNSRLKLFPSSKVANTEIYFDRE